MRIKDFTDTIRHLTDSFNIPEARRMIQENPALTQEQFKAGGIVDRPGYQLGKTITARETEAKRISGRKDEFGRPLESLWDDKVKFWKETASIDARTDISGKVHDTPAEAIAADKKKLYPEGQKSPKSLAKGIKKLPDGKYSVRSKYKADLGEWPDGTKKAKTHYFDSYDDAVAFKKEAIEQPKKAIESAQEVMKTRSEWVKKFYTDNIDKFDDYDSFINQMKEDWVVESKKPKYIDIEKRVRLSDDIGLPLLGDIETEISGLKAPKKGEVSTHAPSKAFYKKAFLKGKGLEKIPSKYKQEKIKFRKDLDRTDIKGKVRRDVLPVGSGIEQHHPFQKRYGESLEKLIPTTADLNRFDDAENALTRIDAEKARLELEKPPGWEKDLKKWEAVEKRIIKQKSIVGITLPKLPAGTTPKLVTTENPLYYDPKRKGMLGRMETIIDKDTGEITYKPKGVSRKKTFAGLSEDALTKIDFSDVLKGSPERTKIVNHMTNVLKGELDCTLAQGKNCNTPEGYRKSFNELVEKAAANDKASITKMQRILKGMKKLKGPLKWTGYGILGEIGFMVPFAAADYTKGESWKRIMGNASDWGFGPMFGQSEDEEIISYLPEGSLGAETKIAEAASERVQALTDPQKTFPKGRIGMDPKRFQEAQTKMMEGAVSDLDISLAPFMVHAKPGEKEFSEDLALLSMEDWKAAQAQIQLDKLRRIAERQERGFIADEDWSKNFDYRGYRDGGIVSLLKK